MEEFPSDDEKGRYFDETYTNIKSIRIRDERWNVWIKIEFNDGTVKKLRASADACYTYQNGIAFGDADDKMWNGCV